MLFSNRILFTPRQAHRCYAIMTRAKHRAGIPIASPQPAKPIKKKQIDLKSDSPGNKGASTVVNYNATHTTGKEKTLNTPKKRPAKVAMIKKPAGISERIVQIPTNIVQPADPHMLRVAVIGAANAGKSTLVNKLIGEEVSGVSPKAHTTRERVLAVLTEGQHQIVFLDTPGIIPDRNHAQMNRTLATSSWRSLDEADHVMIVVDANWSLNIQSLKTEQFLLSRLHDIHIPATLVFNKMDLVGHDIKVLEDVKNRYERGYGSIQQIVYTSATEGKDIDTLKNTLFSKSLSRPWEYPAEQKVEMPNLKRVEEIIRVEFFKRLHHYIPYMIKQENVGWTELNKTLVIDQNVYVERDSQLKIIVGSNGKIINNVIADAKDKISRAFGRPVKLNIQAKVRKAPIAGLI
ncbi:hypothetical protein G6F70_001039 [Rhizopus microsporus]|uniref:Era Like 12S Mitochondrial RRNA Chaperone 1 n=2 Tax=Rhizopus TaxID=4842 RepID=A0A367K0L7_RHIAZ|nr:hypothetical protein G6F71_002206 [Rhizopus microsporus]RCH95687.1 Era Like 12S Mitochondrial RRNA Chaperone 1 [Rhizopus azygosporus]KAG1203803.1 hypothetical protein G6F70_001039 [Rhizopus microsporus]KAG1214244.1 hypothetical protein G6F69_002078 [Rhizopus microsporus]KAG1236765.1 hypothetical protein G6F67_001712 [Rhizopus microsporus]